MVFKAYDIRGVFKEQIDENFAYSLGKSIGKQYNNILVGNDVRIGSKELTKPFIYGLLKSGAKVSYAGTISTPLIYFGTKDNYDLGVILTASHNPPEYTGFKMCDKKAIPISPIDEIKPIFEEYKLNETQKKEIEEIDLDKLKVDIITDYKRFFLNRCASWDIKIAVDFANGSTSLAEKDILEKLVPNHVFINDYPDGTFPAHQPDTLKKSCLVDIINAVKENNCDMGVIFDGDGDRIGIIDEKGNVLQGDILTALIAIEILKEKNKDKESKGEKIKIVYDLRCSKIVPEIIEKYGGAPIKTRVGHYFIKKLMHEVDAEFAGELSNHFYFKEVGYFESPLLALNYILCAVRDMKKPLSELSKEYKKYFHSGEINFKVKDQKLIMEKLKAKYSKCKIEEIDGISIYCDNWWFNIRASNTEPLLRLNLEANTEELMHEKIEEIRNIIEEL
ncbi:phosphomannomutase/phosphoglucomutase [Methanothermococcus okinawensis]|uniref:Phosphoglucomutase/phosphomannomutase alpha/beta/alpha domain I n=1 Tax=Methanothermococcus okinawensis (strain DSM 14208 / JCM 11175 / IH1) TaxID=647113 RepID=F8ANP4_METOI|nr:phosphomannomutase/phosphoglucomutase [Methanothermococcus okinawensis]AEH06242.1 phosphoglucomutase/phosphomannomutase alpha/beta/alpha domain I [Methanothermococcus okinawensis IH1]